MRWLLTVLLVGCAGRTAPARHVELAEGHYPPAPETYYAPVEDSPAQLPRRQPCPECDSKRAELNGTKEALEVESKRREDYVNTHCSGTVTYTTRVFRSGARASGGPERAWLCDGKLVEVPETPQEQALAIRMGDLYSWIRKNCEDENPPAVGEKRCVWP